MNQKFMDLAFKNAEKALANNEVPIGAVIVKNNEILACGYNKKEKNSDVLSHAELIAIKKAEKKLNNWRLDDCEMYVTLEPCLMCASAIKQARIKRVYAAVKNSDKFNSELVEKIFLFSDNTNSSVEYYTNLSSDKSKKLLSLFFENQRKK